VLPVGERHELLGNGGLPVREFSLKALVPVAIHQYCLASPASPGIVFLVGMIEKELIQFGIEAFCNFGILRVAYTNSSKVGKMSY